MNRHAWYRPKDAFSRVQIGNSSSLIRMKNALRACAENAAENMGKNDLFQALKNSKKSRKALSGGRYNLKHFVTARGH
ncbi:hypothetical protein D7S91_18705 [Burkholderia contaminans]|nr:hypothetical protein [Burkholderia contaminans]MBA9863795.1 hypothetical protein [Burkholderia contaminans]MBA9906478.1 hypothetical protein [Burkholderia contaminans]RDT00184.1 hypothetical protein DWU95_30760 [Burkholderia contaminans]